MMPLLAYAAMTVQRQFTYRIAAISGVATNLFFGMLRAAVMLALYTGFAAQNGMTADTLVMRGMTLRQAIDFTAITQTLILYLALFGWWEFMDQVRTGDIGSELLRPVNLYLAWLARDVGRAFAGLLTRGVPILLVFVMFYDTQLPGTLIQWLGFAATLLAALWVSFGWRFLLNLLSFWTPEVRGIGRTVFSFAYMLSGFLLPLRFYPQPVQTLAWLTPFPATVSVPVEAFLGVTSGPELLTQLLVQIAWGAGLTVACQWTMRRGLRKLVIQGG